MADTSVSRIYQFLNEQYAGNIEQFKEDIDGSNYGNGDGVIWITEFRSFLYNAFDWEDNDNANDIINKFWKSIDINKSGYVAGSRITNKDALDTQDLAVADFMITTVYNAISDEVANHVSEAKEAGIPDDTMQRWKDSIKTSMINQLTSKIKTKDDVERYQKNADALQKEISAAYKKCVNLTTADCIADVTVEAVLANLPEADGYEYQNDSKFNNMKERCIKTIGNNTDYSLSEVVAKVREFVNAYANTADTTGRANDQVAILDAYSYHSDSTKLNNLQKQVLANKLQSAIEEKLKTPEYSEFYDNYGEAVDAAVGKYVESKYGKELASKFNELVANIGNDAGDFFTTEIKELKDEYDKFIKARQTLYDKVAGYTDAKYVEALQAAFGSDVKNVEDAQKVIMGFTTLQQVEDADKIFTEKVNEINGRLAEDSPFWSGLQKSYTIFAGTSQSVATLPTAYGSHSTGTLSFSSSNNSLVQVDSSTGEVKIIGDKAGKYFDGVTITVVDKNDNNKVLGSYKIDTITILALDDTKAFNLSDGGKTQAWTISKLFNNTDVVHNAYCILWDYGDNGYGGARSRAIENLRDRIITPIANALKAAYPEMAALIESARITTENYYNALIGTGGLGNYDGTEWTGSHSVAISYYNDVTKQTVDNEMSTYSSFFSYGDNSDVEGVDKVINASGYDHSTGLYCGIDWDKSSNDDMYAYIDPTAVLKKMLSFLGIAM